MQLMQPGVQAALEEGFAVISAACRADTLARMRPVALHEAAHAVVAICSGIEVGWVSLDPPACAARPPSGWIELVESKFIPPGRPSNPVQRAQLAAWVRTALAGCLSTAEFGELHEDDSDMEWATVMVVQLGLFGESAEDGYMDRCRCQAQHLLAENREAVEAVAEQLLERGQLSGAEVRRIVRSHAGRSLRQG